MKVPREIRALAKRHNLTLVDGGRHPKLLRPNGSFLASVPSTPSDHRGVRNALAYLKRAGYS